MNNFRQRTTPPMTVGTFSEYFQSLKLWNHESFTLHYVNSDVDVTQQKKILSLVTLLFWIHRTSELNPYYCWVCTTTSFVDRTNTWATTSCKSNSTENPHGWIFQMLVRTSKRQLCLQDSSRSQAGPRHYSTCWFWLLPCILHICCLWLHQSCTASLVLSLVSSKRIYQRSLSRNLEQSERLPKCWHVFVWCAKKKLGKISAWKESFKRCTNITMCAWPTFWILKRLSVQCQIGVKIRHMSVPFHVIRRVIHFVLSFRHNHYGGTDVHTPMMWELEYGLIWSHCWSVWVLLSKVTTQRPMMLKQHIMHKNLL